MNFIRSRREILFGGGGALLATAALPASAMASAQVGTAPTLRMIRGGTSDFQNTMVQVYPQLTADASFAAVAPLCYLLQNRHTLSLRALSLQWSVATGSSVYNHPQHLELPAKHHSLRTGQRALMGPYGFLLVSPFFAWHPGAVPKSPIPWTSILAGSSVRQFMATELLASKATGLQYHGAIYADGTTVGPATKHLAKRTLLVQGGEHDCAFSIAKKLKNGATHAEIATVLNQYLAWRPATIPTPNQRLYQTSRRNHAAVLLDVLTKYPANFALVVESNATQKRLKLV